MVKKSKVESTSSPGRSWGGYIGGPGKNHMAGIQGSHPSKSGKVTTSQPGVGSKFIAGGKGHMFGIQGAHPAKSGKTSPSQPGVGAKFASGGSTKMFGYTGSQVAKAGMTAK